MRQGENRALIEMICRRLPCQVGGGLKTAEDGRRLLSAGAKRVIYGSSSFGASENDSEKRRHKVIRLEFAEELKRALGEAALCFSVDTKGGRVAVQRVEGPGGPDAGGGSDLAGGFVPSPASRILMPNSLACLIELIVSAPALASPSTLAPLACAWIRRDEKSRRANGYAGTEPTMPPSR